MNKFIVLTFFLVCFFQSALIAQSTRKDNTVSNYDLVTLKTGSQIKGRILVNSATSVRIATLLGNIFSFTQEDVESITRVDGELKRISIIQKEEIFLKDGTTIKGRVIEKENNRVKIRTSGDNVFVFTLDQVEKITQEPKDFIFQNNNNNVSLFSAEERIEIFEIYDRKLWLTIFLTAIFPSGGYYYLWSAGTPYFNFVGDSLWQDITISTSTLLVNGLVTYFSLESYLDFGLVGNYPELGGILNLTFISLLVVIKGIEFWQTISRNIQFNQYLAKTLLIEDEVTFKFNFRPEILWKNNELVVKATPFKFYFR